MRNNLVFICLGVLLAELFRQTLNLSHLFSIPFIFTLVLQYGSIIAAFAYLIYTETYSNKYIFVYLWLSWAIICVIRGLFSIEIYWDAKNLLLNTAFLLLPVFCVLFTNPIYLLSFLRKWNIIFVIQLLLIIVRVIDITNVHFIMGIAFLLYGSFFTLLPTVKWKTLIFILLLIMLSCMDDRSQVIKAAVSLCVCICILFDSLVLRWLVRIFSLSMFPLAIVLLFLGITGKYNIFDHKDHSLDNIAIFQNGQMTTNSNSSLSNDTRTFLYVDIISSAYLNKYVLFGRTPARGCDAPTFFAHMGTEELEPDMRLERTRSEFCHPNILTWMGLLGVFLYAFIYLHAVILGLFFSQNSYIIYIAGLVAFNWFYGWIENIISFDMMNIGLWILIGICLSPWFRSMDNVQFKQWFISIFDDNKLTKYHRQQLLYLYLKTRLKEHTKNENSLD